MVLFSYTNAKAVAAIAAALTITITGWIVFSGTVTFTGQTTFQEKNGTAPIVIFKNNTGVVVATITGNGFFNGPILNPLVPDYSVYINSTDSKFYLSSGKNGTILTKSTDLTDASTVIQTAINFVNSSGVISKGGWIDVDVGTYPIGTPLKLPLNGNMTFSGHGSQNTIFTCGSPNSQAFMWFGGTPTKSSFFNHFRDFQFSGTRVGKLYACDYAFRFNTTQHSGQGISDSIFSNLFLQYVNKNDFYLNDGNCWNNVIEKSVLEHSYDAAIRINATTVSCMDLRVINNKIIHNGGYGISTIGSMDTYIGNFFHNNSKTAIFLNTTSTSGYALANVVSGNIFLNNGQLTGNTYYDIDIAGVSNAITGNVFYGANSASINHLKSNIFFEGFTHGNLVTSNVFNCARIATSIFSFGTASIKNYVGNNIFDCLVTNSTGLLSSNYLENTRNIIGVGGITTTITNTTQYTVYNGNYYINMTGGTGINGSPTVNATIWDNGGNRILRNQGSLSMFPLSNNFKIAITYKTTPTLNVYLIP